MSYFTKGMRKINSAEQVWPGSGWVGKQVTFWVYAPVSVVQNSAWSTKAVNDQQYQESRTLTQKLLSYFSPGAQLWPPKAPWLTDRKIGEENHEADICWWPFCKWGAGNQPITGTFKNGSSTWLSSHDFLKTIYWSQRKDISWNDFTNTKGKTSFR